MVSISKRFRSTCHKTRHILDVAYGRWAAWSSDCRQRGRHQATFVKGSATEKAEPAPVISVSVYRNHVKSLHEKGRKEALRPIHLVLVAHHDVLKPRQSMHDCLDQLRGLDFFLTCVGPAGKSEQEDSSHWTEQHDNPPPVTIKCSFHFKTNPTRSKIGTKSGHSSWTRSSTAPALNACQFPVLSRRPNTRPRLARERDNGKRAATETRAVPGSPQ